MENPKPNISRVVNSRLSSCLYPRLARSVASELLLSASIFDLGSDGLDDMARPQGVEDDNV
jgi:hypothetical protein